ncbi:MAG: esterase/lipase family protein, partial [Planctomycetota bacterium]
MASRYLEAFPLGSSVARYRDMGLRVRNKRYRPIRLEQLDPRILLAGDTDTDLFLSAVLMTDGDSKRSGLSEPMMGLDGVTVDDERSPPIAVASVWNDSNWWDDEVLSTGPSSPDQAVEADQFFTIEGFELNPSDELVFEGGCDAAEPAESPVACMPKTAPFFGDSADIEPPLLADCEIAVASFDFEQKGDLYACSDPELMVKPVAFATEFSDPENVDSTVESGISWMAAPPREVLARGPPETATALMAVPLTKVNTTFATVLPRLAMFNANPYEVFAYDDLMSAAAKLRGASSLSTEVHLSPRDPLFITTALTILAQDRMTGSGTVYGDVYNGGLISPGNSPGKVSVAGNLVLGRAGELRIEIGGTSPADPGSFQDIGGQLNPEPTGTSPPLDRYDQVAVQGNLVLGGSLKIDLINGFQPTVGQSFDIITFGGDYSGDFDRYLGLVGGGYFFKPMIAGGKLTLVVHASADSQPRPVIFIPGFGGTQAADSTAAGMKEWFLNRGPDPSKLVLEPLSNAYSDFVQTLVNVGYTVGVDLFVVTWDWRVPVALSDSVLDGVLRLASKPGYDIQDTTYESGLDYLGGILKQASLTWQSLRGSFPPKVDIVTHSTGGLVARSYLQSDLYQANDATPDTLPELQNLIQVGVPNQGTGATFNYLLDNFRQKSGSRLIGRSLDIAFEYLRSGELIRNPGANDTLRFADLQGSTEAQKRFNFIGRYIQTLTDLMATYEFLDSDADGQFETMTLAGPAESGQVLTPAVPLPRANRLLLDLNFLGPATFASIPAKTRIVYSDDVTDQADRIVGRTGFQPSLGIANELLPFSELIGHLPKAGERWFSHELVPGGGDGTVAAISASGGFSSAQLVHLKATDAGRTQPLSHSELMQDVYSQQQIVRELTGNLPAASQISTNRLLPVVQSAQILIDRGLINPVDYAREGYSRIRDLVGSLKDTVSDALNKKLPLINRSVNELLFNDRNPLQGIGFDFFDQFASKVTGLTDALTLSALETRIENLLGIQPDQFAIQLQNSQLTLSFNFDLSRSLDYQLALDSSFPVQGNIPLTLGLRLNTGFSLTLNFSDYLADPKLGFGTNSLAITLDRFQASASLDSNAVNLALDVDGLGTLQVSNGTAHVQGLLDVAFSSPSKSFSVAELLTVNSFQNLVSFNPVVPLSFVLPVTLTINTTPLKLQGAADLKLSSANLLDGKLPAVFLQGTVTQLNLFDVIKTGPGFTSADITLPVRTVDVDTNGDGVIDLPAARLDGFALNVASNSPVTVHFGEVGDLRVSGKLALATVTPAGASTYRYLALRMGDVVTQLVAGTPSIGLSGDFQIAHLNINMAASGFTRLNWSTALDFNGDRRPDLFDPGQLLASMPSLPIDFDRALRYSVAGSIIGTGADGKFLIAGPLTLSGAADFALSRRTVDVDTNDDGNTDLLQAELNEVAVKVTSSLVTVEVTNVAKLDVTSGILAVATVTPAGSSTARYVALRMGNVTTISRAVSPSINLSGTVTVKSLDYNSSATGFVRLNWSKAFDFERDGAANSIDPAAMLPVQQSLPLNFTSSFSLRMIGAVASAGADQAFLTAGDVSLTGTAEFALERRQMSVDTDGNGSPDLNSATLDTLALTVNQAGVIVKNTASLQVTGNLAVARVIPAGATDARYTALKMGDVTVSTI